MSKKSVSGYSVMAYSTYGSQWVVAEGLSTRAAADQVIVAAVAKPSAQQVRYAVESSS